MRKDTFLHEIKGGSARFGEWTLWPKPTELINDSTGEVLKYKNVADAYENAVIEGRPLKDLVEEMDLDDLYYPDDNTLDDTGIMIMSLEEAAEEWPEEYGPLLEEERKKKR